jgi:hypothetical protein
VSDHRRELLEEVLRERSKVVADLPIEVDELHGASPFWALGLGRVAGHGMGGPLLRRRRAALLCGVVVLAWLEAIDKAIDVASDEPFAGPANRPV